MEWTWDHSTRSSIIRRENKRRPLAMWALSARMLTPSLSVVQTLQRSYSFLIQGRNSRWVHKEMPHLISRKKPPLWIQRRMQDHCRFHRKEATRETLWCHATSRSKLPMWGREDTRQTKMLMLNPPDLDNHQWSLLSPNNPIHNSNSRIRLNNNNITKWCRCKLSKQCNRMAVIQISFCIRQ